MKWNISKGVVDIYFGEAKIHQDLSGALSSAFKSITSFHEEGMCKHEFLLVTKQFKYSDKKIRDEVKELLKRGEASENVRINHACLIGYSWKEYGELISEGPDSIEKEFRDMFEKDAPRVVKMLNNRFKSFDRKFLNFDFFFIPFVNVQDFRDAFNKALK